VLDAIIRTLDPSATIKQRMDGRTTQARKLMEAGVEVGKLHLLLIEEAHSMDDNALRLLKRLHEMRLGRRPLLGILLVGQTELKDNLDPKYPAVREVAQRCEIVELLPLDNDVKPYLAHLAKSAGADLAKLIDDSGIEELRRQLMRDQTGRNGRRSATSLQYPLAVNNMMTAALNMAAELGVPIVNRDVVKAV
jgi:type II secretory pathway predicted ATPase ExeA